MEDNRWSKCGSWIPGDLIDQMVKELMGEIDREILSDFRNILYGIRGA